MRKHACWLWVNCLNVKCLHRAPTALAPHIIRWGGDASSDVLRAYARCSGAGGLDSRVTFSCPPPQAEAILELPPEDRALQRVTLPGLVRARHDESVILLPLANWVPPRDLRDGRACFVSSDRAVMSSSGVTVAVRCASG